MRIPHSGRRIRAVLAAASLLAGGASATTALGVPSAAAATAATASAVAKPAAAQAAAPHIMTIMMENTDYSQVAGSPATPYLNELAHQYATFTGAYGWTYPSLPNYVELLSGSDDGTAGHDCDITDKGCSNFTNRTLVDQLEKKGISWNAYYQGDRSGCYQGDGGGSYPYWHNSFRYFKEFRAQCEHISNFSDLLPHLDQPRAADFQWVVPDLVNSGGDSGTMASGDSWLNGELPKIMASSWYRQGGQIVILYDSGYQDAGGVNGSSGGQIPMVVVSARTAGMGAIKTPVNTAGVLRSIEKAYGLPYLASAANAKNGSLGPALASGRPVGGAAVRPVSVGATIALTAGAPRRLDRERGTISVNGLAALRPGRARGHGAPVLEVGQNAAGQGVIVEPGQPARAVPGTADLEAVACTAGAQCYAVGLGALNSDQAVLVSIVAGRAVKVTHLPAFIGLYGVACPTAKTCYAVGYDSSGDADAVTTITRGRAGAPAEVKGGGEWLNAISCPTANECYAAGLVNYLPSIVPVGDGKPGTAVTIPGAWYVNGIDCPSAGNCVTAGENSKEQGIIGTLVKGKAGPTTVVRGTEYLYGAACASATACVVTGAGTPARGYARGVVVPFAAGKAGRVTGIPFASGLGQVLACGRGGYRAAAAVYAR